MADPQFEEFRVVFDNLPQHIKAPSDCYRLAHDIDSSSEEKEVDGESSSAAKSPLRSGTPNEATQENLEVAPLVQPWIPHPETDNGTKRKRRKLPEIPADRKPLSRFRHPSGSSSQTDPLSLSETESTNTESPKRLIRQVSQNMVLEIDTSDGSPRPLLRYLKHDYEDSSPEEIRGRFMGDIDSGNSTAHTPDGIKSISPVATGYLSGSSSSPLSSTPSGSRLQLQDATHRGLHKFLTRHTDELSLDIGDPIYVQKECDDLWYEGVNLRTGQSGIFPSAYVTDLEYSDFDPEGKTSRKERYLLDFLGSIEVGYHKGNDVLCQAVRKVVRACAKEVGVHGPHPCILEVGDQGLRMVDHKKPLPNHVPMHDYFYNLKHLTFCGYHPHDYRYFGFITKHPLHHRFACHIFMGRNSTRDIAEAVGRAFHRFYYKFMETAYPVEDIYIE